MGVVVPCFDPHLQQFQSKMASDIMWGGLPFMVPSGTAMKYLHHAKVIPEEEVPSGAHYRARKDMLDNVRGYGTVKKGLERRITQIEGERRRARSVEPFISTSGVSASYLSAGHEYWAPMDPIFYYEKSCCFRPVLTRSPLFKNRVKIGWTEPRHEETLGYVDVRKKLT